MTTGSSKSTKTPPASPIGMHMHSLAERMKKHKTQKAVNESLSKMHMASTGIPLDEKSSMLKKAYLAGVKFAEESVSENSSTQNSALGNTDKTEEERMIEVIRRGWPDQVKASKREMKAATGTPLDEENRQHYRTYNFGELKDKAQMTPGSPETTI